MAGVVVLVVAVMKRIVTVMVIVEVMLMRRCEIDAKRVVEKHLKYSHICSLCHNIRSHSDVNANVTQHHNHNP